MFVTRGRWEFTSRRLRFLQISFFRKIQRYRNSSLLFPYLSNKRNKGLSHKSQGLNTWLPTFILRYFTGSHPTNDLKCWLLKAKHFWVGTIQINPPIVKNLDLTVVFREPSGLGVSSDCLVWVTCPMGCKCDHLNLSCVIVKSWWERMKTVVLSSGEDDIVVEYNLDSKYIQSSMSSRSFPVA